MKVLTNCAVHVVHAPRFFEHPVYDIPEDGTDIERIGAFAAKGCYDAFGRDGRSVVDNQRAILDHNHGSVIEHANVGIWIEGVTRALTLELNRHRTFSISQRSTRYTKEEDAFIVLEPYYASIWNKYNLLYIDSPRAIVSQGPVENKDVFELWDYGDNREIDLVVGHVLQSAEDLDEYSREIQILEELNPRKLKGFALRKWARGKARNKTPHSLETRGVWTTNMRGWRWFIELRMNAGAEPEIRALAEKVLNVLRPLAPTYFEDFQLKGIVDGIPEYVPTHSKV